MNSNTLLIATREFRQIARTKSFWLTLLILPITFALTQAITQYVLSLASVFILALIIDALAPSFDGTKNQVAAFKVAAYSATASWVAGVLYVLPAVWLLVIIGGLYSLYLFWLGLPRLMRVPEGKAVGYVVVVIIAAIVLSWLIGILVTTISRPMMGYGAFGGPSVEQATVTVPGVGSVDVGKLQAESKRMEAVAADIQNGTAKAVPADQLQAMLPAAIGAYARTGVSSASMGAGGLGGSNAEGTYKSGDQEVKLEVTDMGAAGAIAGLASAMNVNSSSQNENGYEKTSTVDGRMTTEKWDKSSNSGEYGVLVARQFMVKASGQAPIDTLKQAVASVDLAKLEGMVRH